MAILVLDRVGVIERHDRPRELLVKRPFSCSPTRRVRLYLSIFAAMRLRQWYVTVERIVQGQYNTFRHAASILPELTPSQHGVCPTIASTSFLGHVVGPPHAGATLPQVVTVCITTSDQIAAITHRVAADRF